jgi:hypothetical protein
MEPQEIERGPSVGPVPSVKHPSVPCASKSTGGLHIVADTPSMKAAALAYAAGGWLVFPLHTAAKDPHITEWPHVASCDPAIIDGRWSQWPTANVGLQLAGLAILDVDPRHDGPASLATLEAEHGPLDACARQRSGGNGLHYLSVAPAGIAIARGFRLGLDLLTGAGCYIVVAPSLHPSGGRYAWSDLPHPLSEQRDSIALAEPPQWLLDVAMKVKGKPAARRAPRVAAADRVPIEQLIAKGLVKVSAGEGRNTCGLWLACQMRDSGYSREETSAARREWVDGANLANSAEPRYGLGEFVASVPSITSGL